VTFKAGDCWFCRGGGEPASGRSKPPEPDGKPLCARCKAQLSDFQAWLYARVLF